MGQAEWEEHYTTGNLPWDTGEPDEHLVEVVRSRPVEACAALELGCGTGTNALWLARRGFDVLGIDIAPSAIEQARVKLGRGKVACRFEVLDFLKSEVPSGPFSFVFDRGCLHTFDQPRQRARFAERVARNLKPDGLWLSLIGSTEGPPRDYGPPRRSVRDVVTAIEPWLQILDLRSVEFKAHTPTPALAWLCVSRKRRVPAQRST